MAETINIPKLLERLSASAVDANGNPVTNAVYSWSIVNGNGNAFIDANGNFIASAAGTYQVTATINGVTSAPANVVVYGQDLGIKLAAVSSSAAAIEIGNVKVNP